MILTYSLRLVIILCLTSTHQGPRDLGAASLHPQLSPLASETTRASVLNVVGELSVWISSWRTPLFRPSPWTQTLPKPIEAPESWRQAPNTPKHPSRTPGTTRALTPPTPGGALELYQHLPVQTYLKLDKERPPKSEDPLGPIGGKGLPEGQAPLHSLEEGMDRLQCKNIISNIKSNRHREMGNLIVTIILKVISVSFPSTFSLF